MNEHLPNNTDLPAKLFQGDQLLSIGRVALIKAEHRGIYWPEDETRQDIPNRGVHLTLIGKEGAMALSEIHQCTAVGRLHYHFQVA